MSQATDTTEAPQAGALELAEQVATPPAPVLGDVPTVPAQDEMRAMFQLANVFAASTLVPTALRDKPNDCLLVMMTARDLGLSLTTAFRECHVIDGKVSTSPKVRKAIVTARGLGKIWPDPGNNEHEATWYAVRADMPEVRWESTFTMDDARKVPAKEHGKAIKLCEKSTWRAYPKRMLSWRALGQLMDDAFTEVGTGLYSPDELGAVTDEDGRPVIDVTEVEVPEGMHAPRAQRRAQRQQDAAPGPPDPDELKTPRDRITALPEAARKALVERWGQPRSAEAGGGTMLPVDDQGRPATGLLDARSIKSASALVQSFEREVAAGNYGGPDPQPASQPQEAGAAAERENGPVGPAPGVQQLAIRSNEVFADHGNAAPRGTKTRVLDRLRYASIYAVTEGQASSLADMDAEQRTALGELLDRIADGLVKVTHDQDDRAGVDFTAENGTITVLWQEFEGGDGDA